MMIWKNTNLLLRLILELCVPISIVYWGFHTKYHLAIKLGIGIVLPIAVMLIWGTFVAPKAPFQLQLPLRILVEMIVFGLGAYALFASGHPHLGNMFIILVCVNLVLLLYWKQ